MSFNIKINSNDECRRFSFSKQESFTNFVKTIKELLGKVEEPFSVLYLDDEKEWVKISTELEWNHLLQSIPLFNNALRVRVVADKAKKPSTRREGAKSEASAHQRSGRCFNRGERGERKAPFLQQLFQHIAQAKAAETSNASAGASASAEKPYSVGTMLNEVFAALNNIQGKPQEEVKPQPQEQQLPEQQQPQEQAEAIAEQVSAPAPSEPLPFYPPVEAQAPVAPKEEVAPAPVVVEEQKPVEEPVEYHDIVVAPPAEQPSIVTYPSVEEVKPVQEPFSTELSSLELMGFSNKALNLHLLKHFNGDVAKAIDSLLSM